MESGFKRLVAIKAAIADLHLSQAATEPGGPTGLALPNGQVGYRFNLIGSVVSGPDIAETNVTIAIDDGTGSLLVRSFDRPELLEDLKIGQVITVIGRPRNHPDGASIAPEIVKPSTPGWLAVRRKELAVMQAKGPIMPTPALQKASITQSHTTPPHTPVHSAAQSHVIEEEIMIEETATPERTITDLIRKHDTGTGAEIAVVLSQANLENGMAIINRLLHNGDIFAVGAGRYKVLE